jgi:predicted transcriptional regulator
LSKTGKVVKKGQVVMSVMKKERNRWEIISDILKVTREEKKAKKIRIMQKANLDGINFQKYLDFLLENGFMAKCNINPDCYELTENGIKLSKSLKEVAELIDVTPRISNHFKYPTMIFPAIRQIAVKLGL